MRMSDHFPALCRLALAGNAMVAWYNSISDPQSSLFFLGHTSDGATLFTIAGLVGTLLVLDVLVNDWTPEYFEVAGRRFRLAWRRAFQYRHYLFASLAFCYAAQPYVAERSGYSVSLLIFFYWNTFLNIAVAFLDAKLRSRGIGWQRACN
jgi:hypothetical protein